VSVGHLCLFFCELSVQLICLLIQWGHESLRGWCLELLYILVPDPLSDVQLAKVFPHCAGCLFTLVTVSFVVLLVSYSPIYH
jgi:hypothetical protein